MEQVIGTLLGWLLRAALLAMGLVFIASLLLVAGTLFALWLLRALWLRLTGRPVTPWAFKFNPRAQWGRFHAATAPAADRSAKAQHTKEAVGDITDVVPREIKPDSER